MDAVMRFYNVEFYNARKGDVIFYIEDQPQQVLTQEHRRLILWMLDIMKEKYTVAYTRCCELYSNRSRNIPFYEFTIVKRFIRCNFGEQDELSYDIDDNGNFCFEYVRCPLRGGFCDDEGIICKPRLNSQLSQREMQIFRLIVAGFDAAEISNELCISVPTVNRHRENIKAKLKVRTVAQMVSYWNTNKFK